MTGETKSDWWHLSNKQTIFPKHELIDEFRRESGGYSFHIISLSDLLTLSNASNRVVSEVKQEEVLMTNSNRYNTVENAYLIAVAYGLSHEISNLVHEFSNFIEALDKDILTKHSSVRNSSEQKQLSDFWEEKFQAKTQESLIKYHNEYKSDVIQTKEAILNRLPIGYIVGDGTDLTSLILKPGNIIGLKFISKYLDDLARSLDANAGNQYLAFA